MRGVITPKIQEKAVEVLGREITQQELRLIPYVHYVMMNEQSINPRQINQDEREILSAWREEDWLEGGAGGLSITKKFWDALSEIVWLSYVAYEKE